MAFSYGPYTFDAQADGDAAAFSWTDQSGTTTTLANANTAGRWCHDTNATTSSNVGPDHGQGGDPDGYAYTEMSSQTSGDIFYCEFGTALDASTNAIVFDYYWCARGDSVEMTIEVETNEGGAGWVSRDIDGFGYTTIPGTSGATEWNNVSVDLTGVVSNASTLIRIKLTCIGNPTSSMWHNDVGIDTIEITGTDLIVDPEITNCGDEDHYIGETGVVITGTDFGTDGANSRVRINSASNGAGTDQVQTDTSWADTSINFTASLGSLSYGTNYLFVRNQSLDENATGYPINLFQNITTASLNDTTFYDGQTSIEINGTGFNATQGSSKIYLCDTSDGSGTNVEQTVTAWTATKVTFTVVDGALSLGTVYVIVARNQSGLGDSSERFSPSQSATLVATPTIPSITDVEDENFIAGETNVVLDGTGFESTQGTGLVELCPAATYGSAVTQTINSWSDTQIEFTAVKGGLSYGINYMFVTNDAGYRNPTGYLITLVEPASPDGLYVEGSFQTSISSSGLTVTTFLISDEN